MTGTDPRLPPMGPALTPRQVIGALRWANNVGPDQTVQAIRAGAADPDLAAQWPELSDAELAILREDCSWMSRNRLRYWKDPHRDREATWLDVRAFITGLRQILE